MVVGRYPIDPRTPNERGSASTRVPRIFARHPDFLLEVPVWDEQEREGAAEGRSARPSPALGAGMQAGQRGESPRSKLLPNERWQSPTAVAN